jgi:hypothetical protein
VTSLERVIASIEERIPTPMDGVPHGGRGYSVSVTWAEILVLLDAAKAQALLEKVKEAIATSTACLACLGAGRRFRAGSGTMMVACSECLGSGRRT